MGLDTWAIQLLGRWGSTAVLGYVRDAAASPEAAVGRRSVIARAAATADDQAYADLTLAEIRGQVEEGVEHVLAERAPRALAQLRAELLRDLRDLAAPAAPPSSPSSSSSSGSSGSSSPPSPGAGGQTARSPVADHSESLDGIAEEVASAWTDTRHRVAVGPRIAPDRVTSTTACGWKFALTSGARAPRSTDSKCCKCWPA